MTDLSLMSYFLSIELMQKNKDFYLLEKICAGDVLKVIKMESSKPISTSVKEKLKLTKESKGKRVDATQYKRSLMFVICKGLREFFINKDTLTNEILYANNIYMKLIEYANND
ncbi:hypothetical protein CR513_12924, partial [Mucuna pruriens]